jgi:hypothetical protein
MPRALPISPSRRPHSPRSLALHARSHWQPVHNQPVQTIVISTANARHNSFGEDASRIHSRHGGENIALLRRLALGLLKRHPSKASIPTKRYEASLDVAFLEEVLKQEPNLGKP